MLRSIALLALAAGPLAAQDTLLYNVAIQPNAPHVSVEARLSRVPAGTLTLPNPPSSGPGGTYVAGLSATDDRGRLLETTRSGPSWVITVPAPGAVRFRYRLDFHRRVTEGSTSSGLDSTRLYAVTRSMFVAPDPTSYRKTGRRYPAIIVQVLPPAGWQVVAGWPSRGGVYFPADGDELLGATLAAAPDFRLHHGRAGSSDWQLALRGSRYFSDSTLSAIIAASLERASAALGAVPVPLVTYTGDLGRKGRTSGSLQGTGSIGLVWEPSEVLESARGHDVFHETLHLWFGGAMESPRWWTEGVTDYVAARLWAEWRQDPAELAALVFQSLRHYQAIEHRTRLTMAQEAREGMGGDNTELLVYRKGMLAGLLLDAAIRRSTGGRQSLDQVARRLLERAAQRSSRGIRENEIRDEVIGAGGREVRETWDRVVAGSDPVTEDDVQRALRVVTGRGFDPPTVLVRRKELRR